MNLKKNSDQHKDEILRYGMDLDFETNQNKSSAIQWFRINDGSSIMLNLFNIILPSFKSLYLLPPPPPPHPTARSWSCCQVHVHAQFSHCWHPEKHRSLRRWRSLQCRGKVKSSTKLVWSLIINCGPWRDKEKLWESHALNLTCYRRYDFDRWIYFNVMIQYTA